MKNISLFSKNNIFSFNKMLILGAFLITMIAVITGKYVQEGYMLEIGDVSQVKIKAPRRVENESATERNRAIALEASEKMEPITGRDASIDDMILSQVESFFDKLAEMRRNYKPLPMPEDPDEEAIPQLEDIETNDLNIPTIYVQQLLRMSTPEYNKLQDTTVQIMLNILSEGVQHVNAEKIYSIDLMLSTQNISPDDKALAATIIHLHLRPNFVVNELATEDARRAIAENYDKVFYEKDQTIVDEGQVIREDIYTTLETLGLVDKGYSEKVVPIAGSLLIVISIFSFAILYITRYNKSLADNKKETLLIFTLYILLIVISRATITASFYLTPIVMFSLLVALLIGLRLALILSTCSSVILLLILKGDIQFFIYVCFAGSFVSLISSYTKERSKIVTVGLLASLINAALALGLQLFFERVYSPDIILNALFAGSSGLLYVVLAIGTLPLWEATFGVITNLRLLEFTNPNNPLLRRLTIEAPGTYHHSLIVANLAETAAFEVGANPNLARVGGYFHDIGKLKYPQYFAENQANENPHDYMDPLSSTQVIIGHVTYGIELANRHKLPKVVRDIIESHQGTTLIKYFYVKMLKENPDNEISKDDFRYPFRIPHSKEEGVVMLADTVEAAVRSMIPSGKSLDKVEEFVRVLIKDKLEDGQLLETTFTIKDIELITKSFMRVFKGMYHERIPYPKAPEINSK